MLLLERRFLLMGTTKRARKLHLTEEGSRQLLQRSGVALVVSRGVGQQVEMVNDTFTRVFGYTIEDIPDVAHWWPIAYPDKAYLEIVKAEWQTRVTKAIANRSEIEPMEAKVRCKDGSERYIEFHFSSIGETNIVSFVDLTERKRAEIALRESEERFRLMADAAPVLIWMAGIDKLCTYFNKSWLNFTGRTLAQELGNGWAEGVHPADLQRCLDTYRDSFDERVEFNMEYRLRHNDGEYHWIIDAGAPRFNPDGSFAGYIGAVVDITQRKLGEEALRESEEKFRSIFRDAGVGMVLVSPDGRFLAANQAFCDCLGYTEQELVEQGVASVTLPEDWPAFSQKLRETLTGGRGFQWFEKRCLHKSGRIVYTESSASVIQSRDGDPQYLVGQVLDITERKKAEEALAQMSRKLIAAQEQERARIGRELHDDITQRLALLTVELEELRKNPAETDIRVQQILRETMEIAGDVQALSHELHASKLEYLGVIKGLQGLCKEVAQRQGLEIEFTSQMSSALPYELGICFFRVLQEALHNAVKYSGAKRVEVQLTEDSNKIHLMIHDSGVGFDVEAARQGSGLGLTSMQERVRLVNGTITIQSRRNGGTTIHAYVPFRVEHDSQRVAG
jgi:PAS domain S-box-containing protein